MPTMRGGRAAAEALRAEGVKYVFGIPGHAYLGFCDALIDVPEIRYLLFRHEECAAFAAGCYSRVVGYRPAVAAGTVGPGVAHLVNGILGAYYEGWPLIALGGQIEARFLGKGGLQEAPHIDMIRPITKWCTQIIDSMKIPETIRRAVVIATSATPGPVYIDFPLDMQFEEIVMDEYIPSVHYKTTGEIDDIKDAANLLLKAERPVMVAGSGVVFSGASSRLTEMAELIEAPVITTLRGRGVIPDDHPLFIGLIGSQKADKIIKGADVLMLVGARLSEATISQLPISNSCKIIEINVDPIEIGRSYQVAVVGDANLVLRDLIRLLKQRISKGDQRRKSRLEEVVKIQRDYEAEISPILNSEDVPIHPARAIKEIRAAFSKEAIATGEAGQSGEFAAHYFKVFHPNGLIKPAWGTSMGFALPAAIGAKLAAPDRRVVAICGDGGFVSACHDIEVARRENLGIVFCIFNNGCFATLRLAQLAKYKRAIGTSFTNPDFIKLAEAFKCYGVRVEKPSELQPALQSAIKAAKEGVPAIVDIVVKTVSSYFK